MPVKNKGRKPRNPKTRPYFPHDSGYWAAKVGGKLVYLCRWSAPAEEVEKAYQERMAAAKAQAEQTAAEDVAAKRKDLTVRELCNQFLYRQSLAVQRGELSPTTWSNYKRELKWVVGQIGDRPATSLTPRDFSDLNDALARQYGSAQHQHVVAAIRMLFTWAEKNEYIERAPKYGSEFRAPGERRRRQERARQPLKLFTADQIRALLKLANPPMKAMILLGINCAFLQSDCAELPIQFDGKSSNAIDFGSTPFIRFDRPKTGVRRKATLWPETVNAIRAVIGSRTSGLVFGTRRKRPLVHTNLVFDKNGILQKATNCDAVGEPFRDLCKSAGCYVRGIGFSALRTTLETRCWELTDLSVADQAAIHWIMGHKLSGPDTPRLADRYLQDISNDVLRRVTDRIREWCLGVQLK